MQKKIICALTLATVFAMPVLAQTLANADTIVKKTEKGVCHSPESRYYNRIKHFESYKNVAECVKSGGTVSTTPGMKA